MKRLFFNRLAAMTAMIALVAALCVSFVSCDKNAHKMSLKDGRYSGTFQMSWAPSNSAVDVKSDFELTLKGDKFLYSAIDLPYCYGEGTFDVLTNKIRFEETSAHIVPALYLMWSMNGEFEYTFNNKVLTLTRKRPTGAVDRCTLNYSASTTHVPFR
jgi:hypothetical protein